MTLQPDTLWDARDVATFLKVSRSWVYFQCASGLLPSVRIGGLRRFIPEHIRAYARGEPMPVTGVLAFPGRRG